MMDEILGMLAQVLVFSLIPFTFYLITIKKTKGFLRYVGLTKSTKIANLLSLLVVLIYFLPLLILVIFNAEFYTIMHHPESVTGKFFSSGLSYNNLLILLVIAIFKTAFAEELLFRGFIAKRLINRLGFIKGNLLHALIFGAIHALLFMSVTKNVLFLIVIFLLPSLGAYTSAYLNEKKANGSIIPGWISHATANILSYLVIGFVL